MFRRTLLAAGFAALFATGALAAVAADEAKQLGTTLTAVGGEKAEAVRGAFAVEPSRDVPASLVRSGGGRTTAILDETAASLLP